MTVFGKPDCHLCDVAKATIAAVAEDLEPTGVAVRLEARNILEDPALEARYRDDIPVVLVNGARHARWRVDPASLRAVLVTAAGAASVRS